MRRSLFLFITFLALSATAYAYPRWPSGTNIQVSTAGFSSKERVRIASAVEAWRPFLPQGLTLELSETGNVTVIRRSVKSGLGESFATVYTDGLTRSAEIHIDPSAGSRDKFQRVVEHEIGHVLGLQHRGGSVMTPIVSLNFYIAPFMKIDLAKHYHPGKLDGKLLAEIYRDVRLLPEPAITTQTLALATVELHEGKDALSAPTSAIQYSCRRVITKGKLRRESTIIFTDRGEQIEIDVKGTDIKVPTFPVGVSDVIFPAWRAQNTRFDVAWESGKALALDGDELLRFPTSATDGKRRVEFLDYKRHRTSVVITPVD